MFSRKKKIIDICNISWTKFIFIPDPGQVHEEDAQDQVKNVREVRRQDEGKQLHHPKSFVYKS